MNPISRGIRELSRNKVRSGAMILILSITIAVSVSMLIANQAVTDRVAEVKNTIGNIITVSPAGIRGFQGGGELLTNDDLTTVQNSEHVVNVTATLQDRLSSNTTNIVSSVELGSFGQRQNQFFAPPGGQAPQNIEPPIQVIGVSDTTSLQAVGGSNVNLIEGTTLSESDSETSVVVGKALADKNNLSVGSVFTMYDREITVVGIFESDDMFSQNVFVVPLHTLQSLSDQGDAISSMTVQIDSIDNMDSAIATLQNRLGSSADIVNQQDTSEQALAPMESIIAITQYSVIGSAIAGATILFLAMIMIVRDRNKEIALLKAIGGSNRSIIAQYVVSACMITIFSLGIGFVVGALSSGSITQTLVTNSTQQAQQVPTQNGTNGAPPNFGGFGQRFGGGPGLTRLAQVDIDELQTQIDAQTILFGTLMALLIALVGSIIPAWSVSKVRPAEVLRSE